MHHRPAPFTAAFRAPSRAPSRASSHAPHGRRSTGYLLVFALANTGGVIGYLPLLTLLLPIRIEAIAGEARLGVFTITVIAGAIAASLSNIAFGWLSDRSVGRAGGRRGWLLAGIVMTTLSYAAIAIVTSASMVILAVVAFQIAINAVLAPLLAIMADEVPDRQKGVAGGLLTLANPVASAMAATLVGLAMLDDTARLAILAVMVAACVLPIVLMRTQPVVSVDRDRIAAPVRHHDLAIAWGARLLVQVAGNVLFLYLFYYFESVAPGDAPRAIAARMSAVMIVAHLVSLPIAILVGRVADRTGRTKPLLFAAAVVAATGLIGMAFASGFAGGAVAFCVYTAGASVFLALHATFAMQLLPSPRHRGRDLGLLNLTNTLPALLGPLLTWSLATPRDFDTVMLVLAGLTLCGGLTILAARGRR